MNNEELIGIFSHREDEFTNSIHEACEEFESYVSMLETHDEQLSQLPKNDQKVRQVMQDIHWVDFLANHNSIKDFANRLKSLETYNKFKNNHKYSVFITLRLRFMEKIDVQTIADELGIENPYKKTKKKLLNEIKEYYENNE